MADQTPIISLLTDFGLRDAYVGVMKGVILARCPAARIVDLSHEIAAGDLHMAGFVLAGAWRFFPAGTVHLVVVDPGVGSDRRVLAARFEDHLFVAPDNGILAAVFEDQRPERIVSVENEAVFLKPVSHTFHGRDIFAPVTAELAGGAPLESLGPTVDARIGLPRLQPVAAADGTVVGEVVYVDRFGNLVTNLRPSDVSEGAVIHLVNHVIDQLSQAYADVSEGQLLAVFGSGGYLEISVNRGSAAGMLGAEVGTEVRVESGTSRQVRL
ncbi:MAG: SAM-dependent chlorinase/fluorinase [Phycisphaerae bacterium]|nr:SAM-dependent chlorinase/fluorinase [Phycisphaerae bacterium]